MLTAATVVLILISALPALAFPLVRPYKPLLLSFASSNGLRNVPKNAARPGLSSYIISGPSGKSRNISELPERFVKLKQLALKANSGVVVWRDEDRQLGAGGMGRFESFENGIIMDFGADYLYDNACGTPPEEDQKQYILASSPPEILDLLELVEQLMQPSTLVSDSGLTDWMARMKKLAAVATEGPWEWEETPKGNERTADNNSKFCRLLSQSTGACVADVQGELYCGTCTTPSVADARFMAEASPASILRLITQLKRAQVTHLLN
jgi:hypothetical protein